LRNAIAHLTLPGFGQAVPIATADAIASQEMKQPGVSKPETRIRARGFKLAIGIKEEKRERKEEETIRFCMFIRGINNALWLITARCCINDINCIDNAISACPNIRDYVITMSTDRL